MSTPPPSAHSGEGKPSALDAAYEKPAYILAMNVLQSDMYRENMDARDAVDAILEEHHRSLERSEALERKHEHSEQVGEYVDTMPSTAFRITEPLPILSVNAPSEAGISDEVVTSLIDDAALLRGLIDDGMSNPDNLDQIADSMERAADLIKSAFPRGVGSEHVRKLVGKLEQWSHCMSYNESYFGEPAGLVKSTVRELAHAIDPIYPTKTVDQPQAVDPLAGIVIHTATASLAAHPAPEAQAEKPVAVSLADLFDPARLPPRRDDGHLWHPDVHLRCLYDGDPEDEKPLSVDCLASLGWEERLVQFDGDFEEGIAWEPESPGPEWRLACISDTEDGWCAWFMRRLHPQPSASETPSAKDRERMIDAALVAEVSRGWLWVKHFLQGSDMRLVIGTAIDAAIAAQRKEGES